MKRFMYAFVLLLCGYTSGRATKVINKFEASPTLDYAISEAKHWGTALEQADTHPSGELTFILKRKASFEENGTFAYACNKKRQVTLTAGDLIGLLHALYSFCEAIGTTFDITGATLPERIDWEKAATLRQAIKPHVRWRGIRQHVNFPMDISSYPIEQAKEYLQNMVRLRFNKLTIHSYPLQWYEESVTGKTNYAGSFFYGNKHNFSYAPFLREIATLNDSIFCIPKAETVYDQPAQCSQVAIEWMQQLMQEAKRIGLRIQFSFEPRNYTVEQTTELARTIVDTYPLIDDLELITEETGGWGPRCSDEQVRKALTRWFGEEIMTDTLITRIIQPQQSDLAYLCEQIGTIKTSILTLEKDAAFMQKVSSLKLGIYCSMRKYINAIYHLARTALPHHYIAVMPSHGSEDTAQAFGDFIHGSEDLMLTEMYSWIEFDGLMYQQQNAIFGIGSLLEQMDSLNGGRQLHSLIFNHWRTAENRTTFRYAAENTLQATSKPDAFYDDYAERLGIADKATYRRAMHLIDEADQFSKVNLGNIGFCWVGAWRSGGSYTWMNPQSIAHCAQLYVQAGEELSKLYRDAKTAAAIDYLKLLGNRVLCSTLYMNAFKDANAIRTIHKEADGSISAAEQKRAVEICNHALLGFERYMKTYANLLPDRGGEGTVMSIWFSPVRGLRELRSRWGGTPLDEPAQSSQPLDEPPLPIFYGQ